VSMKLEREGNFFGFPFFTQQGMKRSDVSSQKDKKVGRLENVRHECWTKFSTQMFDTNVRHKCSTRMFDLNDQHEYLSQ
jgi:hypothetical protein